jgi:hypothetical protein
MKWGSINRTLHAINFFKPGESQTIIERVVTEAIEKGLLGGGGTDAARENIVGHVRSVRLNSKMAECKLYGVFQDIDRIKRRRCR